VEDHMIRRWLAGVFAALALLALLAATGRNGA
jgi:hypothetical protein